jgi:hypothetical protein
MAPLRGIWKIALAAIPPTWGGCNPMLEWRPRLIALFVVVVLVASVLVTGYFGDMIVSNWEW